MSFLYNNLFNISVVLLRSKIKAALKMSLTLPFFIFLSVLIISTHNAAPDDMKKATPDPKAEQEALVKKYREHGKNVPGRDYQVRYGGPKWWHRPTRTEKLLAKQYQPMKEGEVDREAHQYKPDDISAPGAIDPYSQFSVGELQGFTIQKGRDHFVDTCCLY